MQKALQFIAPRFLTINGKPAPCECDDNTICGYCVQANCFLQEQEEAREKDRGKTFDPLLDTIRKFKVVNVANRLGVDRRTVHRCLREKRIPAQYRQRLHMGL